MRFWKASINLSGFLEIPKVPFVSGLGTKRTPAPGAKQDLPLVLFQVLHFLERKRASKHQYRVQDRSGDLILNLDQVIETLGKTELGWKILCRLHMLVSLWSGGGILCSFTPKVQP